MSKYHRHKHQKSRRIFLVKKAIKPKLIDRLVYFAAVVEPMFSFPQAYQIFHEKSAGSVSILAWVGFQCMTAIWLYYGIVHKEKMIIIYQGLFFIIDGFILGGAVYYEGKWF